jgi:hypothetical protein
MIPGCISKSLLVAARLAVAPALGAVAPDSPADGAAPAAGRTLFEENFEGGLERWEVLGRGSARIVDSGDPEHGRVLALVPAGDAYALIRGSDRWPGVRLEGDVLFPSDDDSYLGVVYDFRRRDRRMDFGVVYIKGNGSYLQANPHRDFNVGRTLYPEYHVPLTGSAAIRIGRWQKFAVEVVGRTCHFYVGGSATPQMTFPFFELDSGPVGLQPRSVGGDVWVDNVRATAIDRFSYDGPPLPAPAYDPGALATDWQVIGPLTRTEDEIAESPDAPGRAWKPFETDARGAVVTARVVDFHGPETVAYFRTTVSRPAPGPAALEFSTVDDLAIWVNGRFMGFYSRGRAAWFDFHRAPPHAGTSIPVALSAGENDVVIRVRGGVYASGGFFARVAGPNP